MIVVPAERIADFKKKGWWSETRIDDLFEKNVREKTDREACVDPINCMDIVGREPRRLSWWQLEDLVSRYTAVFTSHGLRKDDALVVQLPNTVDLPAVYLACARLGIIVSPAPVQYR
jgi:acyl-CoA synthetase